MHNDLQSLFKRAGQLIAATENGVDEQFLPAILSLHNAVESAELELSLCKMAADAGIIVYANTEGGSSRPEFAVMQELAKDACLRPAHRVFRDVILESIGRHTLVQEGMSLDGLLKQAGVVGSIAAALGRAGVNVAPAALKAIFLGTATAGIGGGTLAWLANRHVNEDEQSVEAKRQRAAAYRNMRQEIEGQLAAKGIISGKPQV